MDGWMDASDFSIWCRTLWWVRLRNVPHIVQNVSQGLFLKSAALTKEALCKTWANVALWPKNQTNPVGPPEIFLYVPKSHLASLTVWLSPGARCLDVPTSPPFHCSGVLKDSAFLDRFHFARLAKKEMFFSFHVSERKLTPFSDSAFRARLIFLCSDDRMCCWRWNLTCTTIF